VIWTRDNRSYQTSFAIHALTSGTHTVLLQMADLNKDVNDLRLFIDCQYIGEERTEVPIRESLMGKIVVVWLTRRFQQIFLLYSKILLNCFEYTLTIV